MTELNHSQGDVEKPTKQIIETSSLDELERIVKSDEWLKLRGNYNRPDELRPGDLSAANIMVLLKAISATMPKSSQDSLTIAIPGLGDLQEIGHGEGKVALALTTELGKKIAVIVGGYFSQCGLQISADPRLFMTSTNQATRARICYSDLRQYVGIPLKIGVKDTGVILEEFGGNQGIGRLGNLDPRMKVSREKVLAYIRKQEKGMNLVVDDNTLSELNHTRHYLFQPGSWLPAVIDIPITQKLPLH